MLRVHHVHTASGEHGRGQGEPPGASRIEPEHRTRQVRPNVGVKRETPVWRLARDADDVPHCFAGQAPCRWLSA